jgi:hypothetical protein
MGELISGMCDVNPVKRCRRLMSKRCVTLWVCRQTRGLKEMSGSWCAPVCALILQLEVEDLLLDSLLRNLYDTYAPLVPSDNWASFRAIHSVPLTTAVGDFR